MRIRVAQDLDSGPGRAPRFCEVSSLFRSGRSDVDGEGVVVSHAGAFEDHFTLLGLALVQLPARTFSAGEADLSDR